MKVHKNRRRGREERYCYPEVDDEYAYLWDDDSEEKWDELDLTTTPEGVSMTLMRRGGELAIHVGSLELMASGQHSSEEAMARLAWEKFVERRGSREGRPARMLIGGLGLGYTLRSALDTLPADAEIYVAELIPKVVEWNRGPLGHLADHPLDDPRVHVFVGDVRKAIDMEPGWDMILLDVDNGPSAATVKKNDDLYQLDELEVITRRLRRHGVLAVWSVCQDERFELRLAKTGFTCKPVRVNAIKGQPESDRHTIFLCWLSGH